MHTTNYTDTLILPAPDCPLAEAQVPQKPGSIAMLQHQRLSAAPYGLTSDELLFSVHAERQGIAAIEADAARAVFFAKPQACLRASPLVKIHGWALHHDAEGRVALVRPGSARFNELNDDDSVIKISGMRSKRAQKGEMP